MSANLTVSLKFSLNRHFVPCMVTKIIGILHRTIKLLFSLGQKLNTVSIQSFYPKLHNNVIVLCRIPILCNYTTLYYILITILLTFSPIHSSKSRPLILVIIIHFRRKILGKNFFMNLPDDILICKYNMYSYRPIRLAIWRLLL